MLGVTFYYKSYNFTIRYVRFYRIFDLFLDFFERFMVKFYHFEIRLVEGRRAITDKIFALRGQIVCPCVALGL